MSEFGGFVVSQEECLVQPMSADCSTITGMKICRDIKEALGISLDFSKFEIICDVNEVVRFRIEGPILRGDLERVIKVMKGN